MLITERFVFLHVPKTGGSFVQTVLRQHLEHLDTRALLGEPELKSLTHAPLTAVPPPWRDLPTLWVVRNPWDWYVSWVRYQAQRAALRSPIEGEWELAYLRGDLTFKDVVAQLCSGDLSAFDPAIQSQGPDLYSAFVRAIVGADLGREGLLALRFERLRKELLRAVRERMDVSPELTRAIRASPAKRVSERGPYTDYYDAELCEIVGERTRWLCELFDYSF